MGPPGSGKGTQGERLAERYGITHIAVGDVLRTEVEAGTPFGKRIAETMQRGDLISDEDVTELIAPLVAKAAAEGGFVLDGFPRTLGQAVAARQVADELNVDADVAVWLDVEPRQLIDRLVSRTEGRSDDTRETIRRRLQVYEEATRPLLDYYRGRGLLVEVDASHPPDEVTAAVLRAIDEHLRH
jgi:adenylate kinase